MKARFILLVFLLLNAYALKVSAHKDKFGIDSVPYNGPQPDYYNQQQPYILQPIAPLYNPNAPSVQRHYQQPYYYVNPPRYNPNVIYQLPYYVNPPRYEHHHHHHGGRSGYYRYR